MKLNKSSRDGFSLREQIANEKTVQGIEELLSMGAKFKNASRRTRQGWLNTSKRRIVDLLP